MFCTHCGAPLPEDALVCNQCQTPVMPLEAEAERTQAQPTPPPPSEPAQAPGPLCPNCSTPILPGQTVCSLCGAPLYGGEQPVYPQPPYPQAPYQQPAYPQYAPDRTAPMTLGNWICTMLLMIIPIANLVLLIVWAASSKTNISKQNWARSALIFMGVAVLIGIIIGLCAPHIYRDLIYNYWYYLN